MSPTRTGAVARFATLLTRRRITVILLFLLFALGAGLRRRHVGDVTFRSPDERVSTLYAARVAEKGPAQFAALVGEYIDDAARHTFPPPWRVGYLWPLAEIMEITATRDIQTAVWLSFAVSLATLALVGVMGARYLPPQAALCAMLCLAVSIPDLALARRGWPDELMSGLGLVMAWTTWEITRNPERWWNYALLVLEGAFSCLVKESGVFVFGACWLYVVVMLGRRKAWRTAASFTLGGLAAAALCLYVLTLAAGGLPALRTAQHLQSLGFLRNAYGREYQTGPWYRLIRGFWVLGPLNLVLSGFAMSLSVLPDRWLARLAPSFHPPERSMLRLFSWLIVVMVCMILVLPIAQNFRYLSPIFAPTCLLSGLGLWALLDFAGRKLPRRALAALTAVVAAVVVGAAIADYRSFEHIYVVKELPDLPIKAVLEWGR